MSKFTSIRDDDWCGEDAFTLRLSSSLNPLDRGLEGLGDVLQLIDSLGEELRPDHVLIAGKKIKYSQQILWDHLDEMVVGTCTMVILGRKQAPAVSFTLYLQREDKPERFLLELSLRPFSLLKEPDHSQTHARAFVDFARAFAQRFPLSDEENLGHSSVDASLVEVSDPADWRVRSVYWLNLYGQHLVSKIGREHVLSTPSEHIEELPGGAVLLLTRPTPADFDSEEARLAQTAALVHLRPDLKREEVMETLRQRSLVFAPVPMRFDEDVADILQKEMKYSGLPSRRQDIERFNLYRPPPVSEWMQVEESPITDVEDVPQTIARYEGLYAEQLIALMLAEKVPGVRESTREALPAVDFHLWHFSWGKRLPEEDKAELVKALGAWLGMRLVHSLGGLWVPRRVLEETSVVVGARAWLPFLRARHALQNRDAPLDYSCTQFFRQAQRLSRHLPE